MRKITIIKAAIFVLFASTSAMAQQQQEYVVKLSPVELDMIGKGLGELPFKDAAPLLQKMREQIAQQQQKSVDNEKK